MRPIQWDDCWTELTSPTPHNNKKTKPCTINLSSKSKVKSRPRSCLFHEKPNSYSKKCAPFNYLYGCLCECKTHGQICNKPTQSNFRVEDIQFN